MNLRIRNTSPLAKAKMKNFTDTNKLFRNTTKHLQLVSMLEDKINTREDP